jgi:hypothetical protein
MNAAVGGDVILHRRGDLSPLGPPLRATMNVQDVRAQGRGQVPWRIPSAGGTLAQRDPVANPTIFSGDLAGNDGANFANTGERTRITWSISTETR